MNPIDRLTEAFEKFPGIGPRQARRFVQHLLAAPAAARGELSDLVKHLGSETAQCKKCFRWFALPQGEPLGKFKGSPLCPICVDATRDTKTLFVVEKDADIDNVERSGFRGLYFVLGGTVPLAAEEPAKHIRLKELQKRLDENNLTEIILGLSATAEGDHTRELLQEKLQGASPKITSLGRGLSTGSELEYADPQTIEQALTNRH